MRRLTLALALVITAATALGHENFTVSGDDCTSRNFHWGNRETVVARETIDGRGLRSIKASVRHAPLTVIGNSNAGYSIEACKAATTQADLDAIRVTLDGDELRATGPEDRRWHVSYRIHVPRNAEVEVTTKNGPLALRDVDGTIVARSSNGPLSLDNVSGDVEATTTNGPLSISGGSGNVKARASNGPLSIDLDGNSWLNGSLEASTKNGPLSVRLPRGYNSGVVVESSGRSPFSCRAEGCRSFDDDDDDNHRRVELGNGRTDVRVSTVNGPVTIRENE
ncbi:MAG TPA: hypothetical protein VEK79_00940 [Thermoanaerobaculia bacterium]|nr:hypothetical protein [Thermoanaerobaculia bacterium]